MNQLKCETKRKVSSMKLRYSNITPWLAALVCLTLTPATKATDDVNAPKTPAPQKTDSNTSTESTPSERTPTKANKASGILGMDVRNQNDEHLGHIKDLVIDLKTSQVSYAVMSTAPKVLLGIDEKLLAVPMNALTVSSDQKYLILNADKSKVDAATGFTSDNWPSVNNPSWGAQPFWQSDSEKPGQPAKPTPDMKHDRE
jgi:sporulation protein YlmC with PRC-barrel domain